MDMLPARQSVADQKVETTSQKNDSLVVKDSFIENLDITWAQSIKGHVPTNIQGLFISKYCKLTALILCFSVSKCFTIDSHSPFHSHT